jgi:dienelactone hydrolase
MTLSADIHDFHRRELTFDEKTRVVLTTGDYGPAVIVLHEIFGFTPTLARFCRWVRDAGFRVYAPILLGSPDATNPQTITTGRMLHLCISREFSLLRGGHTSPLTDWLRALAAQAHEECGGHGVGVIGLCLTGGFALAMAVDPLIRAPVMGEPGLPAFSPAALDISPQDLARVKARTQTDGLTLRGYRFEGDTMCRAGRFDTLQRELGDAFIGRVLPDECGNPQGMRSQGKPPHSVFTVDLVDEAGEPTRQAVDEVIAFFKERLENHET